MLFNQFQRGRAKWIRWLPACRFYTRTASNCEHCHGGKPQLFVSRTSRIEFQSPCEYRLPFIREAKENINGHFRNLNFRYLPYIIRPIFQAYFSEDIPTKSGLIWYGTSIYWILKSPLKTSSNYLGRKNPQRPRLLGHFVISTLRAAHLPRWGSEWWQYQPIKETAASIQCGASKRYNLVSKPQ